MKSSTNRIFNYAGDIPLLPLTTSFATCLMFNSHGKHLSVYEFIQSFMKHQKETKGTKRSTDGHGSGKNTKQELTGGRRGNGDDLKDRHKGHKRRRSGVLDLNRPSCH